METQRILFEEMISEHSDKIRYLHSFGEGNRLGIIYFTEDDQAFGVGYNGDFNLLGLSGENFLKKKLQTPVNVPQLSGKAITKVSIGDHKGLALGARGKLYHWGMPYSKIRSSYDESNIQLPHPLTSVPYVVTTLMCGGGFFAVITDSKKVFVWGYIDWSAPYSDGRLFSPMHKEVESISCGAWHMIMLTSDGKSYAFGHGGYGQLGYAWTDSHGFWNVEEIPLPEPCAQVIAGSVSTMCITQSGELWACGLNHPQFGCLGIDSEAPVIKQLMRVQIDEPLSEVICSYTLCNLSNVYAARSKDSNKFYVWGIGCDSGRPQIFKGVSSLHDIFHYLSTPMNLGDSFNFAKPSREFQRKSPTEQSAGSLTSACPVRGNISSIS